MHANLFAIKEIFYYHKIILPKKLRNKLSFKDI